jgi:hypothetical protein
VPISYSTDPGAALGFARRGRYNGALYQISISLDSVVFIDRKYYPEAGLDKEAEVLICRSQPSAIAASDVLDAKVQPQQPIFRNNAGKATFERERARLEKEDTEEF